MSSTCVSASGKVLLAGGYLVLDPKYSGVVVSTSSRFYSLVTNVPTPKDRLKITVRSPQFLEATWVYYLDVKATPIVSSEGQKAKNKFVEAALEGVLILAREIQGIDKLANILGNGLEIVIMGDNDFYSQRERLQSLKLPSTVAGLAQIPRFCATSTTLGQVHKTGLGSSAALISSFVTALLVHLDIPPRAQIMEGGALNSSALAMAHNTAQYVHCLAQGKIGSGFDVSAAIYGSHLYTRFDPKVLDPLMGKEKADEAKLSNVLSPLNTAWNHRVAPFHLPPKLRIVLADVEAGSDTPSLVGKVLKWRSTSPDEANSLWTEIDSANTQFAQLMESLTNESKTNSAYTSELSPCAQVDAGQWNVDASKVVSLLSQIRQTSQEIRKGMRAMGVAAGVPIEPPEQTALLDACLKIPGVVCGGVPGAGGYDAIWLLLIDTESVVPTEQGGVKTSSTLDAVEALWAGWKEMNVSPLGASESRTGGVCVEFPENVPGLMDALKRASTIVD
ncbi:Phosphomevalonate kinase [Clavulina sp. PMI_390]|nr:Phosphomevalonate kinase [Clavulina sp. PMI_390]